ncbi:oxidoreductase [Pseudonocardia sp. EC080610-09]|uniref:flavin reductase family protein n=1 Tax=unclassified Pseudonocardia TaxID=2619320 RepID=UPI0006CB5F62|nr:MULTISPECIES: flavin reductase family protein [unclassified Pseudonocardia]ALE73353.1 oxidoreductase [Pseudonocardia sp. EC080625-04]ALL76689.1 oxidoreductase [Pseudonocardia sp. EC080610-09]ALL83717.1 oxidoreductase [Pseudonocardia sp. EC080619-01]
MSELIPTMADGAVDATGLRRVFGRFPSGVTAVCALDDDGTPVGMAASSFVAVSLDPPLVGLCVQHTSTTWPRLRDRARIGLSVLGDGQDRACRALASKQGDRFAGLDLHPTDDGALLLGGASAWLDCSVERAVPAGDHDLVLLRVHRQCTHPGRGPLVFHESGFHALAQLETAS